MAGSAAFHRDMLCWNGNGARAGEGCKEQEMGDKGRGETPLGLTGRKAKDGGVGSIARKIDKGKESEDEDGEVRTGRFRKTLHPVGVGH